MLKKFMSYYKPHWKLFVLDISCAVLISIIDLIFPMISRYILNDLIPARELNMVIIIGIAMVGIYIIRSAFNYVIHYYGHVLGVRMEYDMRNDLFTHLQKLSHSYYDKVRTGKIMSRMISDLRNITELAHHGPEDLLLSLIMLIGSSVILFRIEWRLTLVIVIFLVIMIYFAIKRRKKMSVAFKNVRKKIANVNADLENSISGIRVAKAFTNEEYEMDKFFEGNRQFKESREFAFKNMASFFTGIIFMSKLLNITVIILGGYFVYSGSITYGDLVAYLLYVNLFMQPIRRLSQFIQQYESGMAGFERFVEVLDLSPEIKEPSNPVVRDVKGNIQINNISFTYEDDSDMVLEGLDLEVPTGKTVALVGPSGSGKSTLCHLIPRFYDVLSGEVLVDGINVKEFSLKNLRDNIGMVQQDVFLFTGTIKDNIRYGEVNASMDEIVQAAKKAEIHDFIMGLPNKYETYIGEKGIRLSGGQKQRLSIARVFLKNPPILILDEATSALDTETEIKIQRALEKLSQGRTTLVIAHRLSTIVNSDKIIVLTDEGIIEKGSHDELLQKEGLYSTLYSAQFQGYKTSAI